VGALQSGPTRPKGARRSTLTSFPAIRVDAAPPVSSRRSSRPEVAAAVQPSPATVDADRHALLQREVSASQRSVRRRRGPLTLEAARA
jgi:hypothetical protein